MTGEQYQSLVGLIATQLRIKLKCKMFNLSYAVEDGIISGILSAAVVMGADNERLMRDADDAMRAKIAAETRAMEQAQG